jgi:hypothetical protein
MLVISRICMIQPDFENLLKNKEPKMPQSFLGLSIWISANLDSKKWRHYIFSILLIDNKVICDTVQNTIIRTNDCDKGPILSRW